MHELKEDVAYGIYDRPGPGIEDEPTALENPVVPGPQMATQLSVEKPPIDDEDYVPTSNSALTLAAAEISSLVPDDQIRFFYRALHRLLDKATDRTAIVDKEEEMQEKKLRKNIESVLLEMISQEDERDFDEFRYGRDSGSAGVDYFGEEEPVPTPQSAKKDDKSNLEDLAKEFGFSGPSGARQYVNRILNRLGFMAEVLDDSAVESLMGMAVPEFISSMAEGGYIDEEDVADLKQAPSLVRDLPSFKYFFVSGFILPAYREFTRKVNNNVRQAIQAAGVPKSAQDTVFNQVTGLAAKDRKALKQKLQKAVDAGEVSAQQVAGIESAVREIFSGKDTAPDGEEFTAVSADKWQSLSRSRRQNILKKALEETLEEMK